MYNAMHKCVEQVPDEVCGITLYSRVVVVDVAYVTDPESYASCKSWILKSCSCIHFALLVFSLYLMTDVPICMITPFLDSYYAMQDTYYKSDALPGRMIMYSIPLLMFHDVL